VVPSVIGAVQVLIRREVTVSLPSCDACDLGERNVVDARCHISRVVGVAHQRHDADQRKERHCCCHTHEYAAGVTRRRIVGRGHGLELDDLGAARRRVVRRRRRCGPAVAQLLEAATDALFGLGVEVRERAPEGLEVVVGRHGVRLGRWPTRAVAPAGFGPDSNGT
jgi:hypothetical protein